MDPRISLLAKNLINYSTDLKRNEKLLIEIFDDAHPLAKALIEECYKVNALPFVSIKNSQIQRSLIMNSSKEQLDLIAKYECLRMENMDAYIGIRASYNVS